MDTYRRFASPTPLSTDWGLAILRVVVGFTFFMHGWQKLFVFGHAGVTGFMTQLGIPFPAVSAVLVTAVELAGGLALLFGAFTRVAAEQMDGRMMLDARKQLLEAALVYYQGFLDQRQDDPSIVEELATARSRAAGILTELAAMDNLFRLEASASLVREDAVAKELSLAPEQMVLIDQSETLGAYARMPGGWGGPIRSSTHCGRMRP